MHNEKEGLLTKPVITVLGVGGAGCNAVNNMISSELEGTTFIVANTDAQALEQSLAEYRIQLGTNTTRGLGAGALPEIGKKAAEESADDIKRYIRGSNMVFITAGMGGGTGTGAAPYIAKLAKELGVLTIAVVTKPFQFEGAQRMRIAEGGLEELNKYVDTLIIIPNQNLFRVANEKTTFADAFKMADEVLHSGVRCITDLIIKPGLINLDFADISTVMKEMGKAMMGTGEANGDNRAIRAAEAAISNPLLDHSSAQGAKGVLINITGGMDMTLFEVDAAANRIREEVSNHNANIIFGSTFDKDMDCLRVSVVATGINTPKETSAKHLGENKPHETSQQTSKDQYNINILDIEKSDKYNLSSPYLQSKDYGNEKKIEETKTSITKNSEIEPHITKDHHQDHLSSSHKYSLSFKKLSPEKPENQILQTATKNIDNLHTSSSPQNNNDSIYEIPAFLRRKKKPND